MFFFTPNVLMYSGLRKVGEAVKAINKKLLMGGRVRDRTRTRVVREGAHDRAFIGEGDGKVGRNEEESGGRRRRAGEHELKMR